MAGKRRKGSGGFLLAMGKVEGPVWREPRYPFDLPALRGWDELPLHPHVTFFVGENGSGKSTLVEALAVAYGLNPEGGGKGHRFATRDTHSELHAHIRLSRGFGVGPSDIYFVRAETFASAASFVDDEADLRGYGGRPLHQQSHGEAFFSIFDKRLRGEGLYILDEPEAALSPNRQLAFLAQMHQLILVHSQFVIATHSPIILAYPDAWIYELTDRGPQRAAYEDLEHVKVTKSFLNRRDTFLRTLLED